MVAELFLSAFLQVLFDRLTPHVGDLWNLARREGLEKKMEAFVTLFRNVDAVLADAEEKQLTDQVVKLWLDDLKELAYDAEDVLDEFSTEALRLKVMAKQQATTSKFPNLVSAFKFKIKMGSKIDAIMSRLKEISKQKDQLSLVKDIGGVASRSTHTWQAVPTTSSPAEDVIYGRDIDKENIIYMLLKDDQRCDVIPIVAMGGAGKTTLAQHVYRDQAVARNFLAKAWVCVSIDFDVSRVMKAILEDLTSHSCELKELQPIQARLEEALTGKRFLIVLDDIWDHTFSYAKWLVFKSLFRVGASGSKIIVTTRQEEVATTVGTIHPYKLELLSGEDCWLLFETHALNKRDDHVALHQKTIRKKVVARCKGLPLAARTLGGVLCSKPIDEWEDILNDNIWSMHGDGDALPVLRLSYHYLTPQLKKCFSHCAIFPQDYKFTQQELVLLWIAEGLIHLKGDKQVIHEGHVYFRELVSRSLFQASSDNNSKFIMHDLVHELAQEVGGETYFRLDDVTEFNEDQEGNRRVRHSSYIARDYDISKRFEFYHKTKLLRTFLPLREVISSDYRLANSVLYLMLQFKKLRVLSFSGYEIYELPDSIGNLKHLRHLDLSRTGIRCLPESICSLYNLQILSLKGCKRLQELPSKMENLTSLCYLDITNADGLQEMPVGLKELKSLEVLSNFIVSKGHGCGVKELKSFKGLSGTLCISNLENVVGAIEAKEASLNEKKNLEVLMLEWSLGSGDSRNGENEKCVLDMLQPNQNLKELTIRWYGGNVFSTWLGDLSFSSMKILRLENCNSCTCLPPLGQLPSLKILIIIGMHGVKSVGVEFYGSTHSKAFSSLDYLSFIDMPEWEKWSGFEVNEQIEGFSSLSVLSIKDCPKLLGNLPNYLPSLKRLVVHQCKKLNVLVASFPKVCELDIDGCQDIANGSKQLAINDNGCEEMVNRNLPCTFECLKMRDTPKRLPMAFCSVSRLKMISIDGCSCLVSLPIALFLLPVLEVRIYSCDNLRTLIDEVDEGINSESSSTTVRKNLSIRCCPSLECLSSTGILPGLITDLSVKECAKLEFVAKTLPASLKYLEVNACSRLEFLVETFLENTKLESIDIYDCQNFQRLPEGLQLLNHLKHIWIYGCPNLLSFPQWSLPNNKLKKLNIHDCKKLKQLPNITSLTSLDIGCCESIKFIPEEGFFTNLRYLSLLGSSDVAMILMNLPISLTRLRIFNCRKFTSIPNLPISLANLEIFHCPELISLPNLSTLSLTKLEISSCPELISLPNLPISLTQLKISDCPELISLPNLSTLSLTQLRISDCPELISLPNLPISLTKLRIFDCPELISLPNLSTLSLTQLRISDCPELISLPNLSTHSLTKLQIYRCATLTSLPNLSTLPLTQLDIAGFSKLISLPNLPISLAQLTISDCENLTYLPSSCFQNLTSLQSLYIRSCPKLKSLPKDGLPPSLLKLSIEECPLLKERCKRDKGKDWHKIADVPGIWIHGKYVRDPESNNE